MTSACGAKIGIECQIYYFVHETLWLFVASMKQEVLSVEPTYERIQSIWVSEFALRDMTFGEFLNIPVVTQEFSGVVFIFFFVREGRAGGGSGFFSNKSFILWFVQLWSVIKPLIQTHIHCYNKARKGTGISLEIALGSNRKNAWKSN